MNEITMTLQADHLILDKTQRRYFKRRRNNKLSYERLCKR